jgi:hypothetical protein
MSQAVFATGAVATFMAMHQYRLSLAHATAVFLCAGAVSTISTLSSVACFFRSVECSTLFPMHATIFSSAFLVGSAAFTAFTLWANLGLPAWAAIVATILAAPPMIAVASPMVAKVVGDAFAQISG